MLRPISSILLPKALETKLRDIGFQYCEDLYDSTGGCHPLVCELLKQFGVDDNYLKSLLSPPTSCTALDMWQAESSQRRIVTFCKALDDMLDGGVPIGQITEFSGGPGAGKTQLCLQLCVDVQIPASLGGLGGQAIFVSTDSGFTAQRLKEIAEGCYLHCRYIASLHPDNSDLQSDVGDLSTDSFLRGVQVVDVHGVGKLLATIQQLSQVLHDNSKVQLLVVDSLAFSFRNGEIETLERTALLYRLMQQLQSLASYHGLAVVVTNQLSTRVVPGNESQLIPSLGDGFAHRVNLRMSLGKVGRDRYAAALIKSPTRAPTTVGFTISRDGIRDCG